LRNRARRQHTKRVTSNIAAGRSVDPNKWSLAFQPAQTRRVAATVTKPRAEGEPWALQFEPAQPKPKLQIRIPRSKSRSKIGLKPKGQSKKPNGTSKSKNNK
jgi:hypothetical protein